MVLGEMGVARVSHPGCTGVVTRAQGGLGAPPQPAAVTNSWVLLEVRHVPGGRHPPGPDYSGCGEWGTVFGEGGRLMTVTLSFVCFVLFEFRSSWSPCRCCVTLCQWKLQLEWRSESRPPCCSWTSFWAYCSVSVGLLQGCVGVGWQPGRPVPGRPYRHLSAACLTFGSNHYH